MYFRIACIDLTLVAGTMFLMVAGRADHSHAASATVFSLIIFVGIIARCQPQSPVLSGLAGPVRSAGCDSSVSCQW